LIVFHIIDILVINYFLLLVAGYWLLGAGYVPRHCERSEAISGS